MKGADFWSECKLVERVPGRLDGRPVIKNTRVEADLVPESIELGETPEQIAANYRLDLKDVIGVRDYFLASTGDSAPVGCLI